MELKVTNFGDYCADTVYDLGYPLLYETWADFVNTTQSDFFDSEKRADSSRMMCVRYEIWESDGEEDSEDDSRHVEGSADFNGYALYLYYVNQTEPEFCSVKIEQITQADMSSIEKYLSESKAYLSRLWIEVE